MKFESVQQYENFQNTVMAKDKIFMKWIGDYEFNWNVELTYEEVKLARAAWNMSRKLLLEKDLEMLKQFKKIEGKV